MLIVGLMGVAAVRARDELITDRPLTWVMLAGFVAVLVGSGWLWFADEVWAPTGRRSG